MTPDKPQNPSQGTPEDDKVREDAQETKETTADAPARPDAKPKRTRAKKAEPEAEGQAAAETGVDKAAAEATEAKPTQRTSSAGTGKRVRKPKAETRNPEGTKPEGKDVAEARAILAFTPRAAAKPWLKLLESAVANAEHNHELVGEELKIAAVHADEGPTLKRFRPRAMGRATRIRKRTSHLSITLTPKES